MPLVKVSQLSKPQKSVVESVPRGMKYVSGPAGTGKTTTGVRRMLRLLTRDKVFANEILVIAPQQALAAPYHTAARDPKLDAGGRISVHTIGSLSRHVVDLFFPLVAEQVGLPETRPVFLSLETAQYFMARVAHPLIEERGYFDMVSLARSRLYSQMLDNLNKAAVVGFPHTEISERLRAAWGAEKDPAQVTVYTQMQDILDEFRAFCIQHNLLDFSLQVELFRQLWVMPPVRDYLVTKYRHIIVDNIEEDTPITHDMLLSWLPAAESALMIHDTDAGYRRFLGAAPNSAERLAALVQTSRDTFTLTEADSFVTSPELRAFGGELAISLEQPPPFEPDAADPRDALGYDQPHFHTEMVAHVAENIAALVHAQGVPPHEIVVLAPYLSDSLRFTLEQQLVKQNVPMRSHRPSRALRDEPAAAALLTWAQLAHPAWQMPPAPFEITNALAISIEGLDRVRARLATDHLYKNGELLSFDALASGVQERITYTFGEKLEVLHRWLADYAAAPLDEVDLFWQKLFDDVLAKRGFDFQPDADNPDEDKITVAANLIDSARKFRRTMQPVTQQDMPLAQEYVQTVRDGVIAEQYLRAWYLETDEDDESGGRVLLAPAYTFLMSNRPVDYQFWLSVGSTGWWERLYQPLTHPYVLTRDWDWMLEGRVWTDENEYYTRNETLFRLALGLIRRARSGIYLGFSELGERGYEQRGALLGAVVAMMRRLQQQNNNEESA
jgi:hypothetical protein